MSDHDWDFLEMAKNNVELKKQLESKDAQINLLREALEELCIDDCGITLEKETHDSLLEILFSNDAKARQALAELDKVKGV